MTIRVGLIGYGLSGRVFHAPFITKQVGMRLSHICTSQKDVVLDRWPEMTVVNDADALLSGDEVDLVVITTPNELHFPQAELALKSNKHVLLEKPSVTELEQIETLCRLANEQGKVFTVYQNRRFDGDFLRLKRLLDSGELGELKHLDSRFDRFRPVAQDRWREQPGVGTGIFWDLGPHVIDQVLALSGTPDWINASVDTLREGGKAHDRFELELGYANRRICLGSTPFEAGEMRRFNARFTQGSWQCFGLDAQEAALRAGQLPDQADYAEISQRGLRYVAPNQNEIREHRESIAAGQYLNFYQQLTDSILGQSAPPVSQRHACELVYAMLLAMQSADSGQRHQWQYSCPF
jgi:predicted dehydrogenase